MSDSPCVVHLDQTQLCGKTPTRRVYLVISNRAVPMCAEHEAIWTRGRRGRS